MRGGGFRVFPSLIVRDDRRKLTRRSASFRSIQGLVRIPGLRTIPGPFGRRSQGIQARCPESMRGPDLARPAPPESGLRRRYQPYEHRPRPSCETGLLERSPTSFPAASLARRPGWAGSRSPSARSSSRSAPRQATPLATTCGQWETPGTHLTLTQKSDNTITWIGVPDNHAWIQSSRVRSQPTRHTA